MADPNKNNGVDPSQKKNDYDNWTWKEIKVAVNGAVDTSHTNELNERKGVSDPQSFYHAADSYDIVKDKLQSCRDDTEKFTADLVGSKDDGWKGPTASAFRDMMNKFKGAYDGHLNPLKGPPGYRATLESAAAKLQQAITDIETIDSDVAGKAMQKYRDELTVGQLLNPFEKVPWKKEDDGTTVVAVSKYPELVDELNRRMRPVIKTLANEYTVHSNDLTEPADVNYPGTGNSDPSNNPPPPLPPPPPVPKIKAPPPPKLTAPDPKDKPTFDPQHPEGPLLGPDGKPLLGPHGELLGPDGKPLLGPHGELLGAGGVPLLGPHGELLGAGGAPLLGAGGRPLLGLVDPATKLADFGGLAAPPASFASAPGGLPGALPGGPLPGANLPGGMPGLFGGLPGAGARGLRGLPKFRGLPGGVGEFGGLGRGLGLPGAGTGRLTSGELAVGRRSLLAGEDPFAEAGREGALGRRRGAGERTRSGQKSAFPGGDPEDALGRGGPPHGNGQGGEQEKERERETWLTEDRDVWGAAGAAVAALGRPDED